MRLATAIAFTIVIFATAWIVLFGSPIAAERPALDHYYGAREPILPMNFAHANHTTVGCIRCHHNYVDDAGGENCMRCHVTHEDVWPLFEEQFHDLCRGCHEDHAARGDAGGPPRRCSGCHQLDDSP